MVGSATRCEVMRYKRVAYRHLVIAPGTAIKLCDEHFAEFNKRTAIS